MVIVGAILSDWSFHRDQDKANDKINAGNDRLIEDAKRQQKAEEEVVRPSEVQVVHHFSRSELVDADSVLSNIASRDMGLDNALRGIGGADLSANTLRLAWTSNVISYEEYQYAQKFRRSQGDFP